MVELESEEYFDVYVSHINSPTSFYLQHVGDENAVRDDMYVSGLSEGKCGKGDMVIVGCSSLAE